MEWLTSNREAADRRLEADDTLSPLSDQLGSPEWDS